MKTLTSTQLNRIKIKDLMAAVKKTVDPTRGMGLTIIELYDKTEKRALADANDNELARIEKLFIQTKLGIKYYPSQGKKTITVNGTSKIVPIDYINEPDNA